MGLSPGEFSPGGGLSPVTRRCNVAAGVITSQTVCRLFVIYILAGKRLRHRTFTIAGQ